MTLPTRGSAPVLLPGGAADWPAMAWSWGSLRDRAGAAVVPVHTGRWAEGRLGVHREGATEKRPAADFLGEIALAVYVGQGYLAGNELLRAVPELRGDLRFPAVGPLCVDVVWLGPAGNATPIHFDLAPNLYVQLVGRKRWRLWEPWRRLGPRLSGAGAFAMSRLDAGKGPEAAGPPDLDVELGPGDVLYLPSRWWHRVDTLTDAIAVNRWWWFGALLAPSHR